MIKSALHENMDERQEPQLTHSIWQTCMWENAIGMNRSSRVTGALLVLLLFQCAATEVTEVVTLQTRTLYPAPSPAKAIGSRFLRLGVP